MSSVSKYEGFAPLRESPPGEAKHFLKNNTEETGPSRSVSESLAAGVYSRNARFLENVLRSAI